MKQLFNKRIPTILGLILILLIIPLITLLVQNQTFFKSRASNSQEPKDVKITNISDQSFTITYRTDSPATGSISYGESKKLGKSELDDADKEKGSFSPKKIHSISIKNLAPSTKYYLTIISGSGTFLNNGVPFEVTTGADIPFASAEQQAIKGKIILPDGNAPPEALVYLSAESSQLLSSIITKDGEYSFSLKELRTNDLSSYFNIQGNTLFTIFATDGSLKSTALASLNQAGSIPTITLSNDYDFAQISSPAASESAKPSGFPLITPPIKNSKPEIITPKENQSFTDKRPQFRGTSLPNAKVDIIIHSDEQITTQVTADNNGNWTYTPPNNLSPGAHTITIKTRDSLGILTTITQSFTVFAAESQTPSLITPLATPTQSATSTPTPIPTATPTPLPTPILIPLPVPTTTPFRTLVPITSKGGLPPTGNSSIYLFVGGIVTAISGLALFLLL